MSVGQISLEDRRTRQHRDDLCALSVRQKSRLLGINRSSLYYHCQEKTEEEVTLMNDIQEFYLSWPFFGDRRITALLKGRGYDVNRQCVYRLMGVLGLRAVYPKKNLSKRRKVAAVCPYLLKFCPPLRANDAWSVDITYIKLVQGFVYVNSFNRCRQSGMVFKSFFGDSKLCASL